MTLEELRDFAISDCEYLHIKFDMENRQFNITGGYTINRSQALIALDNYQSNRGNLFGLHIGYDCKKGFYLSTILKECICHYITTEQYNCLCKLGYANYGSDFFNPFLDPESKDNWYDDAWEDEDDCDEEN